MHPLIDKGTVDLIRDTGNTSENLPNRVEVMEKNNLPIDQNADNVIITGCQVIGAMPHVLAALVGILERGGQSCTLLSKEYCCGNNLYRPAIKERDDDAISECRSLSREFVELNVQKVKKLRGKRLVIFCSPCYPIYKHAAPEEEIIFYPQAIAETMGTLEFQEEIDYYAGCYKLHKKFSPVPMDLKSTNQVFSRIKGLSINRISAPSCCYKPDGLKHMIENVKTRRMVHICTGCYLQAFLNLEKDRSVSLMMLPELVELAHTVQTTPY